MSDRQEKNPTNPRVSKMMEIFFQTFTAFVYAKKKCLTYGRYS